MTPEEAAVIVDRWANEGQPTISISEVVDAVTTILEMRTEYAIEYHEHCLVNDDGITLTWIGQQRGEAQ